MAIIAGKSLTTIIGCKSGNLLIDVSYTQVRFQVFALGG